MIYRLLMTLGLMALLSPADAKPFEEMFPELVGEWPQDQIALLDRMDYKTGTITVGDNLATFTLDGQFYYLDSKDANYVLSDLWGNPPSDNTMGMIFPIDMTPLHDTWGIEISYDAIGYVSDKDAADYDYDALLKTMQKDTLAENPWRKENGYGEMGLVGWAEPPRYDAASRKLYWAKELSFENEPENTLNYSIRALGRKGVLVINFIAFMGQLDEVRAATPAVLAMTDFTPGNKYSDFDPSIDTVAKIGIGGLIAGKVLAKTGLIAVALIFLKKFWILLLLPLLGLKKFFTRSRDKNS